jgi:ribosomal protein L29
MIQENEEMKAAELRQKDVAGIEAEVKALQKAHFGLRMQKPRNNSTTPPRCVHAPRHRPCQDHSC